MYCKISDLEPGDHFRFLDHLNLPDGEIWVYNWHEGNLHACRANNSHLALNMCFEPHIEVFKEVDYV